MKRLIVGLVLTSVAAGALVAACVYWALRREEPEWTTRSRAALEEFLAGFEDRSKHYLYDALGHFERALELDPEFAAAKLYLARLAPSEPERRRWLEELRNADLGSLSPRESFLVTHALAHHDRDGDRARELRRAFLEEHPEDPFAIQAECDDLWEDQRWDEAERCYRRLLRLHPNWVEAQNRLGYIAMARGRFDEAEEQFCTYRYIAPDQAQPYESVSELMILQGRYDEAEEALDEAIRIKSDFCEAYRSRIRIRGLTGRPDLALEVLDELAALPSCAAYYREFGFFCTMRTWLTYQQGDLEGAWKVASGDCRERLASRDPAIVHRVAAMTGRWAEADLMEEALRARFDEVVARKKPVWAEYFTAILAHAEGVRFMAAGNLRRAAESFREADERLGYWVPKLASFKLFNRLHLLRVLEVLGRDGEAAAVRAEMEAVNPRIGEFRIPDLEALEKPAERSPDPSPWSRGAEN